MAIFLIMWMVGFYSVGERGLVFFLKKKTTWYAHHLNLDVYVHFIMNILQLKLRVTQTTLAKSERKITQHSDKVQGSWHSYAIA